MFRHYKGVLGIFDYDDDEFAVINVLNKAELRYVGHRLSVNLPKGCVNTRYMFSGCELPAGFSLGEEFDTSDVTDMRGMFMNCKLPEGFSLGERFDTSKVEDMSYMFYLCKMPKRFSLGDKFDTDNARDTSFMFECYYLPDGININMSTDEIIKLLKQPSNPSAPASGSEVWKILNKEKYTEEFIPQVEKMYDFIKKLVDTCGNTTVNGNTVPTMQVFFDMWNEYSHETFRILDVLVHKSDFNGMSLF